MGFWLPDRDQRRPDYPVECPSELGASIALKPTDASFLLASASVMIILRSTLQLISTKARNTNIEHTATPTYYFSIQDREWVWIEVSRMS